MTKRIKKFFLYIFFLFFIFNIIVISTYSFFVYQPKKVIKFLDKAFLFDYSINIKSISSNKNLLEPFFIIEQLHVNDDKKNELIFIPNLKIGINLIESITSKYISLSILEIDSLKSSQGQSSTIFEPFLIKGNKLKISNETFDISARDFELIVSTNNIKIALLNGNINSYSYENINALIDVNENKIFYKSSHILNSKQLTQIDSLNLSSLQAHDIYLNLATKGYLDFKTNQNVRFDKLIFQNSSITTDSKFLIKNINSKIFSNLNKELFGIYESVLPDQKISGSIFYDNSKSVIRTNLKINMGGIIDSNKYPTKEEFDALKEMVMSIKEEMGAYGDKDEEEEKIGSDPLLADTDFDELTDLEEFKMGTNPTKMDTDGDTYSDFEDLFPLDPKEFSDNDKDGIGDNTDEDDDNDDIPAAPP